MAIPKDQWEWYGYPGHFVCADRCWFRLNTKVGNYIISTVGDMHISTKPNDKTTLGGGDNDFFETYVFSCAKGNRCNDPECGYNAPIPDSWREIDGNRTATAGEAQKAHMAFCLKYAEAP
jgi:hypothetical protein